MEIKKDDARIILFSPKLCYNRQVECALVRQFVKLPKCIGRISPSVGRQLPKLNRRVRLPYPAFLVYLSVASWVCAKGKMNEY